PLAGMERRRREPGQDGPAVDLGWVRMSGRPARRGGAGTLNGAGPGGRGGRAGGAGLAALAGVSAGWLTLSLQVLRMRCKGAPRSKRTSPALAVPGRGRGTG
ncbi:MAG: hypothetical protein ACHRXM_11215, partial [Isosphaerales bacterium]